MLLRIVPLPQSLAAGATETWTEDEGGAQLRCCLRHSVPGERVALVSVSPPGPRGAYKETGPVFLHAEECAGPAFTGYPEEFRGRDQVLRAYDTDGRILGGEVLAGGSDHEARMETYVARPEVAFVHTRNVVFGCYVLQAERDREING